MDNQTTNEARSDSNNQPNPKKKTGLIVAVIVAAVVLIGGGVAAYFIITNSNKSNDKQTSSETKKTESTKTSSACLVYDEANEIANYSNKSDFDPAGMIASKTYFFNADSTTMREEYADSHTASLDELANWIKKYESKSFKVTIAGQVNSNAVGDTATKLANQRAQVIYDQLTQRGVNSDKLEIGQPISASGVDNSEQEAHRNVSAVIYGSTSCAE